MIVRLATEPLHTLYGTFTEMLYYDGQRESIALVMGEVRGGEDVLCRVHSSCLYGHAFNSVECDCRQQMAAAQEAIQAAGRGVVIWLEQEGKGNGHFALMQSKAHKRAGLKQGPAYEAAGFHADARDFRAAADILAELGVHSIQLLTEGTAKVEALRELGVRIVGSVM